MNEDIGEVLNSTDLVAIACYPNGNGYALTLVGADGTTPSFTVSSQKLKMVFAVIGEALQPGLLASLP